MLGNYLMMLLQNSIQTMTCIKQGLKGFGLDLLSLQKPDSAALYITDRFEEEIRLNMQV